MYFLKKIDGNLFVSHIIYYNQNIYMIYFRANCLLFTREKTVCNRSKNSDILIENDKSISRHHATITYDVNVRFNDCKNMNI